MDKKRLIISYLNAPPDVRAAIDAQYPNGFNGLARKIAGPKPFYAIYLDTETTSYLIKVDVKTDKNGREIELPDYVGYGEDDDNNDEPNTVEQDDDDDDENF